MLICCYVFFFQAEDGIRDAQESRGLGDVYKRQEYARCIIHTIFDFLEGFYGKDVLQRIADNTSKFPTLLRYFHEWLVKYSNVDKRARNEACFENDIIYDITDIVQYRRAIIDYMAGMTDNFAIRVYNEIISF